MTWLGNKNVTYYATSLSSLHIIRNLILEKTYLIVFLILNVVSTSVVWNCCCDKRELRCNKIEG